MKLIKSLVGVVVLSFVTSAFAQQEETASPAPKEKASATVQETPTPSPQTDYETRRTAGRSEKRETRRYRASDSPFARCRRARQEDERRSHPKGQ
jgi:hypothetical protein